MISKQMNSIKFVVHNSKDVFINELKIKEFADNIHNFDYVHWSKNTDLELSENEWVLLCFIVESLNFCFWQKPKWEILYDNRKLSGSMAMLYSVIRAVKNNTIKLDINELKNIDKIKFKSIFETNNGVLSMVNERYNSFINAINLFDKNKYIYDELYSIKSDVEMLKYITSNIESFDDKSNYNGKTIYFNKRATLLVNDLFNVSPTIRKNINNVENLSGCADYGVPRVFRDFGVLEYSCRLQQIIDDEKELEHDSEMEIEIRANMLYCIEKIKDILLQKSVVINSVQLDNLIWWIYKKNTERKSTPHHTVTIYY